MSATNVTITNDTASMHNLPVIPMLIILKQYAKARRLPLIPTRWESIVRTFLMYAVDAKTLN